MTCVKNAQRPASQSSIQFDELHVRLAMAVCFRVPFLLSITVYTRKPLQRQMGWGWVINTSQDCSCICEEFVHFSQRLFYSPLVWGSERVWERPSAEGASRVETPQAPRGVGCGEVVSPPHWGRGLGRRPCPLPRNFFSIFGLQTVTFGALWWLFLRLSGLFWTQTAVV